MKLKSLIGVLKGSRLKLLILIFFGSSILAISQQTTLTESDIISNAQSYFDKKDYQAAMPLYAQLVSVHPDDPLFNYRFGVCTLFGDRKDKKKPIRYLNNAAQNLKDDPDLNYYLGLAYHQNQEFANAMKYFNLYLSKLPPNAPERASVLEKVNACINGLNLADKNLVAEIVSSSKFQKDNFHRAYAAQDFNGSLMIKPEIFVSEKERKSGENSYVYLIQPSNILYFSGYTNSDNSNRDIFKAEMDENGDWGIPEKADESINTPFDENYPVLVDNGNTLYFSSKGHNSLGGYDIFRSTIDPNTNKFGQPENLGPGINSPFDDIVYIPTKDKMYVYFASDRDNLNGTINVYKIRLIDNPFAEQRTLAENESEEMGLQNGKWNSDNNKPENKTSGNGSEVAVQQNIVNEPLSDPSKKGALMVNDRSKSLALADSAFAIISSTKDLIRDLTNKRDRANAISQRKADESKTLEARFNESIAQLANAVTEEQFLQDLETSVKLKEDLYQLQQRSNQANKIAWNLGNQVKIKNQELNDLKSLASKIQSMSVTGTYEETLVLLTNYKKIVTAADTLADYSEPLIAITNNKTTFKVPPSELLFAENLKKAYHNNTLLAEVNSGKPVYDEKIPIVVVDKRTNAEQSNSNVIAEQKPFESIALVEPVLFSAKNFHAIDPGNEALSLDFSIDNRIEPLALVEAITYHPAKLKVLDNESPEIEINYNVDKLALADIYPLVDPVYSKVFENNIEPIEASLTLNFEVDEVKPLMLVIPVEYAYIDKSQQFNEEIEISNFTDKSQLSNISEVVEPVYPKDLMANNVSSPLSLEINFKVDEAKADNLVQPVETKMIAQNRTDLDEEIEISNLTDKVDLSTISPVVEPVYAKDVTVMHLPDESTLELSFLVDGTDAEKLIKPVEVNLTAQDIAKSDEELEISEMDEKMESESIAAVIQPVYAKNSVPNIDSNGNEIELKYGVDQNSEVETVIEQVPSNLIAQNEIIPDEDIEIRNLAVEDNSIEAAVVVEPLTYKLSPSVLAFVDETLEINYYADGTTALKLVEPINNQNNTVGLAFSDPEIDIAVDNNEISNVSEPIASINYNPKKIDPANEAIEINYSVDKESLVVYNIIQIVPYTEQVPEFLQIEPALEVNFATDQSNEVYALIDPVQISNMQTIPSPSDNDVELSFILDIMPEISINTLKAKDLESDGIAINTVSGESMEQKLNDFKVTSADEIYFLRESVMQADGIESSKSDEEILSKALKNPDELSYEELIYAANLTDVQEEKIAIYNVAFVHIDRDWRAYNNAAVSEIHLEDLSTANCYLYQASLLSKNNGHIRNNMGILACHLYQFDKAEKYFVAASKLGYDAKYNLQLAHGLSDLIAAGSSTHQEKVRNSEKEQDIIVDIIDYNTAGE